MEKNENSYNFGHFIENIHLKDVTLKAEAVTEIDAIMEERINWVSSEAEVKQDCLYIYSILLVASVINMHLFRNSFS